MPVRFATAVLLGLSICAGAAHARGAAADASPGPARPIPEQELVPGNAPQAGGSPAAADLVLQSRLQTAGKALLASAFILIIAGAALIEADPYAMAIGDVGFAGIGAGIGTFIASAFLLGLSRPVHVHDHPSERRHAIFVAPSRGLALGYVRSF